MYGSLRYVYATITEKGALANTQRLQLIFRKTNSDLALCIEKWSH